ncbi:MAG: YihY/virulence factor BrkB family protein [Chlamydiae bacterium CG10_big_fil_rev_8_21_14_0_10_42_34]|nr:MAG: YihY/virulence factor BrkB family protein [Chlamydiae bacterium CG10_big_fil_rev_8_21_14_0_10_42_34]
MFEKLKNYFRYELWNFPLNQEKGFRRVWIKWVRIIYLSIRGYVQDKCSLSASSLTYYTVMSLVPVLAMGFAIARGFGYNEAFKSELLLRFGQQQIALVELFKFAEAFLDQAKGGVIAGVGLVVLFLAVVFLLNNLEIIFNHIWGIKSVRSWRRILSDYFSLMLLTPILFVLASSGTVFVVKYLGSGVELLPLSPRISGVIYFLIQLIPYGLFWIFYTFIFLFMPNTKVKFSSACIAGIFTGCLYLLVQWAYIYFQVGAARYGAIYGKLAALPLFLVWIQTSWFLTLFGAELSHAHQTYDEHEFEGKALDASANFKKLLSLWITHLAVKKGYLTKSLLIHRYQIPSLLLTPILQNLVDCNVLYEARDGFVPSAEAMEMKVSDLIGTLDFKGENDFPFIKSKELSCFETALELFSKQIESSPDNIRISHVPNQI